MNSPSISVIIPIFNQDKWVGRCLRSLLNQTINRSDFEIIVINDGSTDRSKYALELFDDEIKLLNHEENLGLPSALNTGIKNSKGYHIVRVDSDDFVNENFLFLLHEFLEQNKYMDAVSCDYFVVNDKEEVISRNNCLEDPIGCGIMFKSDHLFEIGLYDEEFLLWEEKELRIRFEKKYKIHRVELPLYRYRKHRDNITSNRKLDEIHREKLNKKHNS